MSRPRRRALAAVAVLIVALAVVAFFFAGQLVRAGIGFGGRFAGYDVAYGHLTNRNGRLTLSDLAVHAPGREPLLAARSVAVDYDWHALLPGAHDRSPFGISRVAIDRPQVTVVHRADGSYNFNLPKSNGAAGKPPAVPKIHLIVSQGSLDVRDATRIFAHSRHLAVRDIAIDANLDPERISHVTVALAVEEAGGTFPIAGRGTFDEPRGYELARLRGRTIAVAPLLDYALNSTSLHVAGGVLNDLDARVYGLPDRHGAMRRHVSVTADLDHFQPYLNGIAKPLRDGRGSLRVYDDGLAIPKLDGSIAGVPVRISGAIYHLAQPTLRLGIVGAGDVHSLLTLNDAGQKLPLKGPVRFKLFVEGDATQPTTLASFAAPRLSYGRLPIDGTRGFVALHGQDTSILSAALGYDGVALGARGNLHVEQRHTALDVLADVAVPLGGLPYGASLFGPLLVRGDAIVAGEDARLGASGVLAGATAGERFAGTFSVGPDGGSIGPLELAGPGSRSLYVRIAVGPLRRAAADGRAGSRGGAFDPGRDVAAFVAARDFRFSTTGVQPALPGLSLPPVPVVSGAFDARLAGTFAGKRIAFGGDAHAVGVRAFGYPIDDVTARAAYDGSHIAVAARYRGALAPLAQAAGNKIRARGSVDLPISIVAGGASDVVAQIHDVRFEQASVAGLALEGLEATARLRGKTVEVYGARLRLNGSDLTARGSFGNGGTLAVSASSFDLAPLRAAGLPVRAGTAAAFATIGGSLRSPHVEGGAEAGDVRLAAAPVAAVGIDASTGLTYDGGRLRVHDAVVHAGSAVAALDGSVSGLQPPGGGAPVPRYAFGVHLRAADIATLAALAHEGALHPEGSLGADVAVHGSGSTPQVSGRVTVFEGSLNGLRFRDAALNVSGTSAGLHVRAGRVTVGSSTLGFEADVARNTQAFALHAPRLRLADFNDFFDAGDTLGGNGSVDAAARVEPNRIVTSGRIRLAHTHIHRFDIGDSRGDWSTLGRTVRSELAIGSGTGRIAANGDVTLAGSQPLRDALHRTSLGLAVRASDVSLERWLPVVGIALPVAGTANANATIRGTYPNIAVVAHADLTGARAGRIVIRTATLDARAAGGRATVTNAVFAIDDLDATLTGSAGLTPHAPIDFTLAARTPDVGALAKTISGTTYDASGEVRTSARLTGTLMQPTLVDTLEAGSLRYGKYTLPRAHAEIALTQTRVQLRAAEFDLQSGRILARGFAPLQRVPTAGIGPRTAPLGLELTAERIDFAQFAAFLPKGTRLTGALDGRVNLAGSLGNPGLGGTLGVTDGSFIGPQEKSKIDHFVSQLTFKDRTVTLHDTSATVGGGTISAAGTVAVPDLADPADSATANLTLTSRYAVVDIPALFKGRINGALNFARNSKSDARLSGNLAVTSARVPTTALLPKSSGAATGAAPLPLALQLGVTVGSDVRVQGGPVDIGATGNLTVGGTLASPTVLGELDSTGGTISFYRTFTIGYPTSITFDGSGVIPNVDALATTMVDNPPTDVTLRATGPATKLNLTFDSDPSYTREQIVGILVGAQALGAVSGIATVPGAAPQQNPFTAAAEGQLGSLLTQNIFEPFSSQLGGAVGLSNLAINYTPGGGASVGAQKKIFKNVSAVFADSFNYPQRQSIGLLASPNPATALQLTFFSQPQSNQYDVFTGVQSLNSTNDSVTDTEPVSGSSGFSFSLQRKF